MGRFDLATLPLNLTSDYAGLISVQTWIGLAIVVILLAVLIYRELRHRQEIQTLICETQPTKMAFEDAAIGMAIISLDGHWLQVNRALSNILGYSKAELLTKTFQEITYSDDVESCLTCMRQILEAQISTYQTEKRYIHKLGHTVWVLVNLSLTRDVNHNPLYFIAQVQDITDRKQSGKKLQESETRLKTLIDNLPFSCWICDTKGQHLLQNAADIRQWGNLVGLQYDKGNLPSEILPQWLENRQRVLAGEVVRFESEYSSGGNLQIFFNILAPIYHDDAIQGFVGVSIDITEQKQAEASLRKSEERYRAFVEHSSEGIWCFEAEPPLAVDTPEDEQIDLIARNFRLVECNDAFVKMYGFSSPAELIGKRCGDLLVDSDPHNQEYLRSFIRSGYRFTDAESHEIDSQRQLKYFLNNCVGIVENGYLTRLWGTQQDITERKRIENEQKQSEAALRQSEATNRALISAIPDLLIWIKQDGTYLDLLGGMKNLKLSGSLPALIGANIYDALPFDKAQERMHYIYQALQTGELQDYEYQLEVDGEVRDEEARIVVCGEQQVLCMVRDITDRKQAERALQQKEKFLQLILDNIPQQIFWKDKQLTYLGCNRLWAETAGLHSTEEVIGKNDYQLPWESGEADYYLEQDRRIIETGQPILQIIEHKLQANGRRMWVRVNKVPIPDVNSNVIGVLGTIEDITESKQVEDVLRSRNQELLTLHRMSATALGSQSSKAAFQGIVEEIGTATGFPIVAIELYDEARQMMVFEGMKGFPSDDDMLEVPVDQTLSGTVAKTGQAIVKQYASQELKPCHYNQTLSQLGINTFICVPMMVHQQTMGVLSLAHPELVQVDDSTLRWVESLANYLALIIHRKQLEASLQQANVELGIKVAEQTAELREAIAQLQQEILQRHQTETALRESEERFRRVVDHAPIGIAVAKILNHQFIMVNQAFCQLLGYAETELLTNSCLSVSHPEDKEKDKPFVMQMLAGEINTYQLEKRYIKRNQQIVWANLTATVVRNQDGDALYLVGMVQDITERRQAEHALQEAHEKLTLWVSDLEQRHQEITRLNEMSDLMQACLTLDEAYIVISQFMPQLFPDCSGVVYAISESKNLVEAVATWGQEISSEPLFTSNECFALRRGQPHYVEDTYQSLCCQHLQEPLPSTYFCVPMVAQGEASGVLYLSLSTQPLTQAKQQLATTVARQIALAVANLKLYATLQNQSIRDPLTGLFNRRYLNEFLERELHRADRNQHFLSILLLDVDHFKQFNDAFGHDAGDAVLRCLSRFLQEHVRGSDIACRYGGEEMVLVLPEASLEDAMQRAEQLRQGVKLLRIDHPQLLGTGTITVSVGVACFPIHGSSSEIVLQAADLALYQAKATGRDRVAVISNPV